MSRWASWLGVAAIAWVSALAQPSRAEAALDPAVVRAREAINALDLELATRELAKTQPDDVSAGLERGRLHMYQGQYDDAVRALSPNEIQKTELGEHLLDVARGTARVTAATQVHTDDKQQIELRFQDDHDLALAPLITDTIVKVREVLTQELGVDWPKPTRVLIVRDLLSLSATTGLPYEAATTTGTVAVAKWGRVTLLSPRAPHHGYAIADTIAHEFTHMAITRATADRAPLWLQEGLAKYEETRWRPKTPFDERPSADAIAQRGIELKLDLPLDGLGPSIAMLPSPQRAMVAYAEVQSFVRFLVAAGKPTFLKDFLLAVREKNSVDEALKAVTGQGIRAWEPKWRAQLAARPKEPVPMLGGAGEAPKGLRDLRERTRLAELLLGRNHHEAAAVELRAIGPEFAADPRVRYLRAREREEAGDRAAALGALGDEREILMSYGPFWAMRGRTLTDLEAAKLAFAEGRAVDPLELEVACEARDRDALALPQPTPLCEAARTRRSPPIGED